MHCLKSVLRALVQKLFPGQRFSERLNPAVWFEPTEHEDVFSLLPLPCHAEEFTIDLNLQQTETRT
ncbi:hypothetical protein OROHE_012933 [Orobanche hederae]